MSDVSAMLLTTGEPYTPRARASVEAQTELPREIIVVENVSPFHRALREGARRVTSPFFVQVDADMILDPACFELLRSGVKPDTGIVVGQLRDPLLGQVVGVKLFRTACFAEVEVPDSISPDTDFGHAIARRGWRTEYIGHDQGSDLPRTYGEHRPDYTPAYLFRKFLLEGRRYLHRGAREGMRFQLQRLETSPHALAGLAQVGVADGFFLPIDRDALTNRVDPPGLDRLMELFASDRQRTGTPMAAEWCSPDARLRDVFREGTRLGQAIVGEAAGATLREILLTVTIARSRWAALVGKVAVARAVCAPGRGAAELAADERLFARFMTLGLPRQATPVNRVRAHARRALARLRRGSGDVWW